MARVQKRSAAPSQTTRRAPRNPLSPERLAGLSGIRELIASGYYNSDAVIDDLSSSLTKAVGALL